MLKVNNLFFLLSLFTSLIVQEYPGRLSFSSGTWASANSRHFVAWTVHLQRQGKPLSFLLDLVEVPEVSFISPFSASSKYLPVSYRGDVGL